MQDVLNVRYLDEAELTGHRVAATPSSGRRCLYPAGMPHSPSSPAQQALCPSSPVEQRPRLDGEGGKRSNFYHLAGVRCRSSGGRAHTRDTTDEWSRSQAVTCRSRHSVQCGHCRCAQGVGTAAPAPATAGLDLTGGGRDSLGSAVPWIGESAAAVYFSFL